MPLDTSRVKRQRASTSANTLTLSDRFVPELRDAFMAAVEAMRDSLDVDDIARRLESGHLFLARHLDMSPFEAALAIINDVLPTAYIAGARLAQAQLPASVHKRGAPLAKQELVGTFDLTNPLALQWLREHGAEHVQISESVRQSIGAILIQGYIDGLPPPTVARQLRNVIGMHPRQAQAYQRFAENMQALDAARLRRMSQSTANMLRRGGIRTNQLRRIQREGLRAGEVERIIEGYRVRLIRQRAEVIARTEAVNATSAGQDHLWLQLEQEGTIFAEDYEKVWYTGADEKVDKVMCRPMHGQRVGFHELFTTGQGVKLRRPSVHPNCRCWVQLEEKEDLFT